MYQSTRKLSCYNFGRATSPTATHRSTREDTLSTIDATELPEGNEQVITLPPTRAISLSSTLPSTRAISLSSTVEVDESLKRDPLRTLASGKFEPKNEAEQDNARREDIDTLNTILKETQRYCLDATLHPRLIVAYEKLDINLKWKYPLQTTVNLWDAVRQNQSQNRLALVGNYEGLDPYLSEMKCGAIAFIRDPTKGVHLLLYIRYPYRGLLSRDPNVAEVERILKNLAKVPTRKALKAYPVQTIWYGSSIHNLDDAWEFNPHGRPRKASALEEAATWLIATGSFGNKPFQGPNDRRVKGLRRIDRDGDGTGSPAIMRGPALITPIIR